jgi:type I restriction enzyme S subunit
LGLIGTLKISRPSLSEQDEIVTMIEHQNRTTDVAITGIEKEITLAEEYRTTLIAEAVTGKIDVREYKIPETVNEEIYEDIEEELSIAAEDEAEYETQEKE